ILAINYLQPFIILIHLGFVVTIIKYLRNEGTTQFRKSLLFLIIFLVTPLILTWISSFKIPMYLPGRTDMGVFGFFAIIMGVSCSKVKSNYYKMGILIILSVISFMTLNQYYHYKNRMKDKKFSEILASLAKDDDFIIFTGLTIPSVSYYLDHSGKNLEYIFFPSDMKKHLGHFEPEPYLNDSNLLREEIQRIINRLRSSLKADKVAWIIYEDHYINAELLQRIKIEFTTYYVDDINTYSLFLLYRPIKIYGFKQ
ncbi:hypothetical protein KKB18_07970, partial [bacterium]|nr:hypothetical protein [bacterium]